jgi:hypothetical protein
VKIAEHSQKDRTEDRVQSVDHVLLDQRVKTADRVQKDRLQ